MSLEVNCLEPNCQQCKFGLWSCLLARSQEDTQFGLELLAGNSCGLWKTQASIRWVSWHMRVMSRWLERSLKDHGNSFFTESCNQDSVLGWRAIFWETVKEASAVSSRMMELKIENENFPNFDKCDRFVQGKVMCDKNVLNKMAYGEQLSVTQT